jgi:hypothetical protein
MIPDGIRERLSHYQGWFKTFLVKEFLNLPYNQQEKVLRMIEDFKKEAIRIHEEAQFIKERTITLKIEQIKESGDWVQAIGFCPEINDEVCVNYPIKNAPLKGKKVIHTVYSLNKKDWYSSKELLLRRDNLCTEK